MRRARSGGDGGARGRRGSVVLRLVVFDLLLHELRVGLAVARAADAARPSGGLDEHVGEEHPAVDAHGCNVRHVDGVLVRADPVWRVVHDACRRNRHLRREEAVTAAQAARPEHSPVGERQVAEDHPHHEREQQHHAAGNSEHDQGGGIHARTGLRSPAPNLRVKHRW